MAAAAKRPIRQRRAICIAIDRDADALLRAMIPNVRSMGYLVSELIRQEARKRDELPQLLERLQAQQQKSAAPEQDGEA